ncbi:MAG: hypothetical protein J5640_04820 [Bacteroidales bacterium]|nr:hypothetical protein [Bacteroidales bacterium]
MYHRIAAARAEGKAHQVKSGRYELWSRDTFEGKTYLCGVFSTLEEAQAELERQEKASLSQDEMLRDTFWIHLP